MKIELKRDRSLETGGKTLVMGILNVTPDSFSDGGSFLGDEAVAAQVGRMLAAGVDIIDLGGESTRPFAQPVPLAEELNRVLPALACIRSISPDIPISIDTTKAEVAHAALAAGADIINDVSALRFDPKLAEVARESGAPVVLMHMQGSPADMQRAPRYDSVVEDIFRFLDERIGWAVAQGIDHSRILVDPGIGFGKTLADNLQILKALPAFKKLGCPLLIGHSRKAFIGALLKLDEPDRRDQATAVLSACCAIWGADIVRVHDVSATVQALRLVEAVLAVPATDGPMPTHPLPTRDTNG